MGAVDHVPSFWHVIVSEPEAVAPSSHSYVTVSPTWAPSKDVAPGVTPDSATAALSTLGMAPQYSAAKYDEIWYQV